MGKSLKQPDLLLTGVPRSGTTLLNSMLHMPHKQWMMYEVFLHVDIWDIDSFMSCERWGAKQINVPAVLKFLELRPRKVIAITRDLRSCAMSYAMRAARHYCQETQSVIDKEIIKRLSMVSKMARFLTDAKLNGGMDTKRGRVPVDLWIKYEDFVSNPEGEMRKVKEETGWEMGGSPTFFFDNIRHRLSRDNERDQHGGKVTTKGLNKYADIREHPMVSSLLSDHTDYKKAFYPE